MIELEFRKRRNPSPDKNYYRYTDYVAEACVLDPLETVCCIEDVYV